MRLAVSFVVPLVLVACSTTASATGSQADLSQGPPHPITMVAARFGNNCEGPSDDVTALFRQACDGKWRCAVPVSRALTAAQKEVDNAARATSCGGAVYTVDWVCGDGAGTRSLKDVPGSRFRLSCPRPGDDGAEPATRKPDDGTTSAASPPASNAGRAMAADVHGRFLTTVRVGVAERTIAVGDRQSATDPTGAFTLSGVPATYDLAVVDKDGARLALFLGLSRRDPVISDAEWQGGDRGALRRGAFISGHLAGAALPTPEGRLRATVQFFSVRQPLRRSDAGFFQRASYPGNIGRNPITWRGPPSISGRLLATIHVQGKRDDYPLVGIASKQLTFEDGDNVSEDLAAIPLTAGRIAGTWNPAANPQVASLSVAYQFSDGSGEFWVGACRLRDPAGRVLPVSPGASPIVNPVGEQPFSCPLPDVSMLPGRYRVFLVENYGSVLEPEREHLTTCTIQPGGAGPATPCEQATRDAPAPPDDTTTEQFTSPPHSQFTDIGRNFRFAWKPRKNAVYAIDLLPRKSFNLVPRISLYTRKTSFGWSDLAKYGIGFPTGAKYLASVRSIQVSSVDQVASLEWWYGRDSESARIAVQSSGVRLMDPAAPVADAKARSNVMDLESFPAGLPACASERKGEVLGARSLGRVVTITGKLGLTAGECIHLLSRGPAQNCASYWAITEVAGSSLPVSLVRTAGVARPSDGLRVAATGLFTLDADDQVPVLEQANLCVLPTRQ